MSVHSQEPAWWTAYQKMTVGARETVDLMFLELDHHLAANVDWTVDIQAAVEKRAQAIARCAVSRVLFKHRVSDISPDLNMKEREDECKH